MFPANVYASNLRSRLSLITTYMRSLDFKVHRKPLILSLGEFATDFRIVPPKVPDGHTNFGILIRDIQGSSLAKLNVRSAILLLDLKLVRW